MDDYCPLCGTMLGESIENKVSCPECSFSFTEQDGVLIFDFRDLEYRMEFDKQFKKAIFRAQEKGLSGASEALTDLFDEEFKLTNGDLKVLDISEPTGIFNEEGLVFASFSRLKGRISGTLLMVVDPDSLKKMALLSGKDSNEEFGEAQRNLVTQAGRLLTSAVCDRFASEFQTRVDSTPPFLLVDMSSAIFNYIFSEFSQVEDEVDYYFTDLVSKSGINISLMFFPHPSTKSLFISSLDDVDL
jgi:chemotaxis protein CheY-P-specific phosphatase CheC